MPGHSVRGDKVILAVEFFHPQGFDVESQVKVKLISKEEQVDIPKGVNIFFKFANNSYEFKKFTMNFNTDRTVYKENPLLYMDYIDKGDFFKSTFLEVQCRELGLSGKINLR